jgi:hypothetical protein
MRDSVSQRRSSDRVTLDRETNQEEKIASIGECVILFADSERG